MKMLLLWLLPLLASAQTPFTYQIKGQLGALPATAKVYLLYKNRFLDSTALKNGAFELRGTSNIPKRAQLVLAANGKTPNLARAYSFDATSIFLEPGPLSVSSSSAQLYHATVKGGPATQDYQRFMSQQLALATQLHPRKSKNEVIVLTWEQYLLDKQQFKELAITFIKANPSSWASLNMLLQPFYLGPPQYDEVAPLYNALSPTLRTSQPGQAYGQLVQSLQVLALGAQAPDFTQPMPENKIFALRDLRGRYVLLDFWASGCDDCEASFKTIRSLRQKYQGRNFDVVGISLDKDISQKYWLRTIREQNLTWTQASDLQGIVGNAAAISYHVERVPQNFLIDPAGKIVGVNLYGGALTEALARLLPPAGRPGK